MEFGETQFLGKKNIETLVNGCFWFPQKVNMIQFMIIGAARSRSAPEAARGYGVCFVNWLLGCNPQLRANSKWIFERRKPIIS